MISRVGAVYVGLSNVKKKNIYIYLEQLSTHPQSASLITTVSATDTNPSKPALL